jgi:dihydrodipicolinate synthase/N-acetylneuraminate lyase
MTTPSLRLNRPIEGISAVLLPFGEDGTIEHSSFGHLVERTWRAGLTPAVNMDTGYANLLTSQQRMEILGLVGSLARGRKFVAGAYIEGEPGDPARLYRRECSAIACAGGVPILFPCSATQSVTSAHLVDLFRSVASECDEFLGFELGEMFVPFGRIWDAETYRGMLSIPQLKGAKHSSLSRELEWNRLSIRDQERPDFKVYTGNDLAIDLVMWGSDYLLGLSAFHVEAFRARDRFWAEGDARFYELNDWLQYLGMVAFRAPVPAYKHSCAQFLHLRGLIPSPEPHTGNPRRPDSDLALLEPILRKLDELVSQSGLRPPVNPPAVP